jgi:S1-C subfamily serine protease
MLSNRHRLCKFGEPIVFVAKPIAILLAFVAVTLLLAHSVCAEDTPRIGLKIRTLTTELRKQHHLGDDVKGAFVTAVQPGSPAQEKGIIPGDVIVEAGGKPVATAKAVAEQISAASASTSAEISFKVITGNGERRDVSVLIPKKPAGSPPLPPAPK